MYQKSQEDQQFKIYASNLNGNLKKDPVFRYLCEVFWPNMEYATVIKTLDDKARVGAPESKVEKNLVLLINRQMKEKKYNGLWKKAKKYFIKKTQEQTKLEEQLEYVPLEMNQKTQHLSP